MTRSYSTAFEWKGTSVRCFEVELTDARSCNQFKPPAMDQFVFVHFQNQKLRNHSWGTTTMELPYQNSSGAAVGTPKPVKGRVLDCGSQPQSQGIFVGAVIRFGRLG